MTADVESAAARSLPADVTSRLTALAGLPPSDGPGCALGVYLDGQLVHGAGYGLASLEHQVPISPHTLFDIASVSKQLCAAAVLLLAQQGVVDLDADLRTTVFPELVLDVPVTARQCLHHTSGLRDYFSLLELAGRDEDTLRDDDDVVALVARQRGTSFAPGSRHLYSNSGYVLLSALVKRVSGQTLREFTAEHVFTPLGMTSTQFRDDVGEVVPHRATGYESRDGDWRISDAPFGVVGDGGLLTSLTDLARWTAFLDTGEVLGAPLRDALHERGVLFDGTSCDYAGGLLHSRHRGVPLVGHGGSFVGFRAHHVRAPEHGVAVAVLGNRSDLVPQRLALQALEVVLEHLGVELDDVPALPEQRAAQQALRLGLWRDASSGLYALTRRDGAGATHLEALGLTLTVREEGGRLHLDGAPLALEAECDGEELALVLGGRRDGLPSYRAVSAGASVDGAAGVFRSEELDAQAQVEPTAEGLRIRVGDADPVLLRPGVDEEVWDPRLTVRLVREAGRVSALEASNGRALGVRFDRVGG